MPPTRFEVTHVNDDPFRLDGKVAVVTGGGRGSG